MQLYTKKMLTGKKSKTKEYSCYHFICMFKKYRKTVFSKYDFCYLHTHSEKINLFLNARK